VRRPLDIITDDGDHRSGPKAVSGGSLVSIKESVECSGGFDRFCPMSVYSRIWSKLARARRPGRAEVADADGHDERRRGWVREHAPGRSFVDIGGLFALMGDIAFLAEDSGARSVTLFDVGDPDLIAAGHPEWGTLTDKCRERGSKLRYVQGDLEDPEAVKQLGVHDIAFYSGVLYHTPNPFRQLVHLRQATRQLALITTLTIPEIPGFGQACVWYPYLSEKERVPYAAGYPFASDLLAVGPPFDDRPMYGYGNCWWGITRSALIAMLRAARFEVVEGPWPEKNPFMTGVVVQPLPLDPSLPPPTYFRERGEARDRGEARWTGYDTWYADHRGDAQEDSSP
jgi:hypothetical protein